MIIRCPQCKHTRSIPENAVPPTAELATCPKCKLKFRFRSVRPASLPVASIDAIEEEITSAPSSLHPGPRHSEVESPLQFPKTEHPQSVIRENAAKEDVWDAVDALSTHWQRQMDQHVTVVEQPRPAHVPPAAASEQTAAEPTAPEHGALAQTEAEQTAPAQVSPKQAAAQPTPPPAHPAHPADQAHPAHPAHSAHQEHPAHPAHQDRAAHQEHPAHPAHQEDQRATSAPIAAPKAAAQPLPHKAMPHETAHETPGLTVPPSSAQLSLTNKTATAHEPQPLVPSAAHQAGPFPREDEKNTPEQPETAAPATAQQPETDDAPQPPIKSTGKNVIFPYGAGQDGPPPEERVTEHLKMLQADESARPTRDLGQLREFGTASAALAPSPSNRATPSDMMAQGPSNSGAATTPSISLSFEKDADASLPSDDDYFSGENGIPFEQPERFGYVKGFFTTVHSVLFRGPHFFSEIGSHGSLLPGYFFFLLVGYIAILCSLGWQFAALKLLPESTQGMFPGLTRVALPLQLVLAPFALGLMQLFVTGCIRIALRILAPEQADFIRIFKIVSYSAAPFILSAVPFLGPLAASVWFIAALVTGCRKGLHLSWALSICVPVPPALLLLLGVFRFYL